ncbi:MAG: hypothetical protein AAF657_32385, partial [Acidobacteriota bacterium]
MTLGSPDSAPRTLQLATGGEIELTPGSVVECHGPPEVWRVLAGTVDLYAELRSESGAVLWREHLVDREAEDVLFAFPALSGGIRVVAVGRGGARLQRLANQEVSAAPTEGWLRHLSSNLGRLAQGVDYVDEILHPGQRVELVAEQRVVSGRGIVWAHLSAASFRFLDRVELAAATAPIVLPLSART